MVNSNSVTINVSPAAAGAITINASSTNITAGSTISITGVVTDTNGNPMSGENVVLTDQTTNTTMQATTNASGAYSFSVTFATAGSYVLYSSAT